MDRREEQGTADVAGRDVAGRDAGADDPLAELFEREYRGLCRLVYVIIGDAGLAEDITSEAFVRVFARRASIRDRSKHAAYVRRTAVNLARSAIRRQISERRAIERVSTRPSADGERADTDVDEVWAAVRSLPARQRAAVVLRYYADLPDAEIATTLRCTTGTVRSQLFKARHSLAATLANLQEETWDA